MDTPEPPFSFTLTAEGQTPRRFQCVDHNSQVISVAVLKGETYPLGPMRALFSGETLTVVDIGAHVGAFATLVSIHWPGSTILSFEPNAASFRCLTANLESLPGVRVFPFALAQDEHRLPLHGSEFGAAGASLGESPVNTGADGSVEVKDAGRTLAALDVTAIDILKVDTEGCEVPILRSMSRLLVTAKVIFASYHSEQDRRIIDTMLGVTHDLCSGRIEGPHRGAFCFVRRGLITGSERMRIDLPAALRT